MVLIVKLFLFDEYNYIRMNLGWRDILFLKMLVILICVLMIDYFFLG